jgi:hypothetical protein
MGFLISFAASFSLWRRSTGPTGETAMMLTVFRGRLEFTRSTNPLLPPRFGPPIGTFRAPLAPVASTVEWSLHRVSVARINPHPSWTELLMWDYKSESAGPGRTNIHVAIPAWVPLIGLGTVAAVRSRARLARRPGICPSCHYDFSGLPPNATCPECGP